MSDKSIMEQMTTLIEKMRDEIMGSIRVSIDSLRKELHSFAEEKNQLIQQIEELKTERKSDRRRLAMLEDQMKRKNVIFRGIPAEENIDEAVKKIASTNLKISMPMPIKSTRKLFDRFGKMGVLVELENESYIREIFKHTKNLAGTNISVERDLNMERQEQKKVMLHLKRSILAINRSHPISVREDKLRIDGKWIAWNMDKQLVSGSLNGLDVLKSIYGETINGINFNYNSILGNINKKN